MYVAKIRNKSFGASSLLRKRINRFGNPTPQLQALSSFLSANHDEDKSKRKFTNDDNASSESPQTDDRKNVARLILYWLKKDQRYFDQTLRHLKLSARGAVGAQHHHGIMTAYKQLYTDSISSFIESLHNVKPLDQAFSDMIHVGFADARWAKQYRKTRTRQSMFNTISKHVKREEKKRDQSLQLLESVKQELAAWKTSNSNKKDASDRSPPTSWFGQAINVIKYLFQPSQNENHTQTKQKKEKRNLRKLQHERKYLASTIESSSSALEGLETKLQEYKPLLPIEEYHEATKVLEKTMEIICPELATHIQQRHQGLVEQYQLLDAKTDLTKPHEWYAYARLGNRKVIFHGGPTNSGKTHEALERLKEADKGIYLGPLRLLAGEIHERLNADGVPTNLVTGQEVRQVPFATHIAATVEMAPTNEEFDVAVIDEIQMIADEFRGFAWTRALLGLQCREIHVCGGLEASQLVQRVANHCGDDFELITYERFTPLDVAESSLGKKKAKLGAYAQVQAGDCVVAFSRQDIFAIQREIESKTNFKCCVIYGSLPPETRTEQARRFNDKNSGYDILVASDAIGMGLNLSIRRIIFNSMFKFTQQDTIQLPHSAVKQIAGRAGRRNSQYPDGIVTCRDPRDMKYLRQCMSTEVVPVTKAGLLPTAHHVKVFCETLQTHFGESQNYKNLSYVMDQFSSMAKVSGDFFLCRQSHIGSIASAISHLDLSISDKYTFCMAPVKTNDFRSMQLVQIFATNYAKGRLSGLAKIKPRKASSFNDISKLCETHSELELYLWLKQRFSDEPRKDQDEAARALKTEVIKKINQGLLQTGNLELSHCYIKRDQKLRSEYERQMRKDYDDELEDEESSEMGDMDVGHNITSEVPAFRSASLL